MKGRMQKTLTEVKGCPQKDRTESEGYVGVQTFMWICEDNIVEVPFDKEHLLERIISPDNLLKACKAVQRNKGCSGIDKMSWEQMLPWLLANKDALRGAQKIIDDGYIYVVDLDLERFFDTVSHSKLIEILSRTIKDGRVISLIHKYLRSGVMNKGMIEASEKGTPQGGSLSLLLSNIMLNELDKELTSRDLPFVRYADDSMIFCKSKRAAKRVKEFITRFIEGKLHLKVNRDKTVVSYVQGVKYLGYSFYVMKGKCQLTVHAKAKAKMKARLKELTSRSNGWGYAKRKQKLEEYIKGWVSYYHLANMNYMWGNSRLGYWRIAGSYILSRAITNEKLSMAGYATLMGSYIEWHPK